MAGGTCMKRKILWLTGILAAAALLFILRLNTSAVIGTVSGAQWEYLTIGDHHYETAENAPVDRSGKSRFLGIATNGEDRFYLYSVKENDEYLYCRWEWEGWMYRRIS